MTAGPRLKSRSFDWDEAKRLRSLGWTYTAIGAELGVSASSARLACDDKARKQERFEPTTSGPPPREVDIDRIGRHFEFAADGCWHWTSSRFVNGYGKFWQNGRDVRAHRAMYELFIGPIPEGLELDHLCRVRHCVNPSHLEPVTRAENLRRARSASPSEES